jgi:hypothetical protein
LVSAPRRAAPLARAPSRTQSLPPGPGVARPRLSAAHACVVAPRRPPLSRGNCAAHARRPGVDVGRPSCPPPRPGPPLSSRFSPPRGAEAWDPPAFFLFTPRHRATIKKKPPAGDLDPPSPRFSSLSAPRAAASQLPHRACLRRPPSPHRLATKRPSHHRRRPSAPSVSRVLRALWLASGVRLTFSPLLWCCRTPPLVPPVTGVPLPLLDIAASPPLRPRTSSRYLGEPSPPPPPHQACPHRPHGAHAAIFGTPCPPKHAG